MNQAKEIVIISGKGGTGKTSLAGALTFLLDHKVIADCDVDAANLHLILGPEVVSRAPFTGGKRAAIDSELCTLCGVCRDACRFNAVSEDFVIDPLSCEGCGACHVLCPSGAVTFSSQEAGFCYTCRTRQGDTFVFAELVPGEENSGKLVAMVRNQARSKAEESGKEWILIDGPPGIGCPVISSLTGTHLAVVVTEPTSSGIHDLKRILDLTRHFRVKSALVVNKSDIHAGYLDGLKSYCAAKDLAFLGEIPYEPAVTDAQRAGKTILEFAPECAASAAIREIHTKLKSMMEEL
jgi:MinD superfamily P-loop ATPase